MKTAAIILACWFAFPMGARAACAEGVQLRSVELSHQGRRGMWFDMEVAKCLLADVQRAQQLDLLVADYETREGLQGELTALLEQQLTLAIQEADTARAGQETAIKLRIDAEEKLRSPGRSRALWFAVGMVTSIGLIGVSAYAISATR